MPHNSASRRQFIKNTSATGLSMLAIPALVSSVFAAQGLKKKVTIAQDDIILFQGDSITDAGRKKDELNPNNPGALGSGYAMIAGSTLLFQHAGKNLKVFNKGISGNKVYQLAERWEKDCLALNPDVLSIMIGVNDFWHTLTNNYKGTVKTYSDDLTKLLDSTKQKLPDLKLIIGEPFAVTGVKAVDDKWFPAFNDYRASAKEVATKFGAVWVPYQSIFDKAQRTAPGVYWTGDGVHPTLAGSHLMAHAWLEAVK
ncbi:twin-arginine translocation signal domain-containing protein [Segetibacter sp. 3557_3]|uniref:SGNH/GDSL hydrolase family protein n=1 Tax=Segetibacter sp. 3557_3 TaxID=2547429 RepID=UPI0010591053|nr:SGNH/GDSL hydrolase family protein [Segetibacter sp. 3557_3]TDH27451.1 twin-arginine translocation signal domain-containing protein [Segetibacter sp. 3557_3]